MVQIMIIVSQDKKEILNFERITEIVVSDRNICVSDSIQQQTGFIIGTYKTEERAKEVLQEILKASLGKLMIQIQANLDDNEIIKLNEKYGQEALCYDLRTEIKQFTNTIIYKMPEK